MITRLMRFFWWIGHSGTSAVIAAQFGLAMMPLWSRMRFALISGITSGTFGSMRKAEELSTTTAPDFTAMRGETSSRCRCRPQNSAMSTPSKARSVSSSITTGLPRKDDGLAGRAGARQRLQLADAEAALVHSGDEFGADGAGDADNRDDGIVTHFVLHSDLELDCEANKKPRTFIRRGFGWKMMRLVDRLRARLPRPRRPRWFWSCVWSR